MAKIRRSTRAARELKDDLIRKCLERVGCDPVEGMARIALGDVVALGYMTKKELAAPARFNKYGQVVERAGTQRALAYVPPSLRFMCFKELVNYLHAKRAHVALTDGQGDPLKASVVVHLPSNGREVKL